MAKPRVRMSTDEGDIVLELLPEVAPNHVENFLDLTRRGFYDGKIFHRVIPSFMVQGGCAEGTGRGGHPDGKTIKAEFNDTPHTPGTLSMARTSDPDSAGTQFFITHGKHSSFLDGQYTAFGKVVEGMEVVNAVAAGETGANDRPLEPVTMQRVTEEASS